MEARRERGEEGLIDRLFGTKISTEKSKKKMKRGRRSEGRAWVYRNQDR